MAICNDRRWPETYRVMGLQGVEMVLIGYNTPSSWDAAQKRLVGWRSALRDAGVRVPRVLYRGLVSRIGLRTGSQAGSP